MRRGVPGDLQRQQEMRFDVAARLVDVELRERRVVRAGAGDQHVVDRPGQLVEEPPEPAEVGGVEGGDAGPELEADAVQAIRVARRDDHVRPLLARAPGSLEPDAGAAADHDDGLAGELRLAAAQLGQLLARLLVAAADPGADRRLLVGVAFREDVGVSTAASRP